MNSIRPRALLRIAATGLLAFGLWSSMALAKESVHTVSSGQRLGSIAKRYGVTIEALCKVNGIERTAKIQPGQRLVIPDKKVAVEELTLSPLSDKAKAAEKPPEKKGPETKADAPKGKTATKKKVTPKEPKLHVVERGQTLTSLASRNATTIGAICTASGIDRDGNLRVGQRVLIPDKTDTDGEFAKKLRLAGEYELNPPRIQTKASGSNGSWKKYSYQPKRRGFLQLQHYGRRWEGFVISKKGTILPGAQKNINWVLGARSSGPHVDTRLMLLLTHVSDHFGGRAIRVVSGYRTTSWVDASKHKEGRAVDFSIPGIPNEVVRDYLRTLRHVGVGYYPNSSFVHLDVRGYNAYWIDYAGPGERPRHSKSRPKTQAPDPHPHHDGDEGDDEAVSTERHEPDEHKEEDRDQDARPDELPEEVRELVPSAKDEPTKPAPESAPAASAAPSE